MLLRARSHHANLVVKHNTNARFPVVASRSPNVSISKHTYGYTPVTAPFPALSLDVIAVLCGSHLLQVTKLGTLVVMPTVTVDLRLHLVIEVVSGEHDLHRQLPIWTTLLALRRTFNKFHPLKLSTPTLLTVFSRMDNSNNSSIVNSNTSRFTISKCLCQMRFSPRQCT